MKFYPEYREQEVLLFNNKYLYKVLQIRYYDILNNNWEYILLDLKTKQQVWFSSKDINNHIVRKLNIGTVLYGKTY